MSEEKNGQVEGDEKAKGQMFKGEILDTRLPKYSPHTVLQMVSVRVTWWAYTTECKATHAEVPTEK